MSVVETVAAPETQSAAPVRARSQLDQNLGWIILALLLAGCLIVLRPFVSALLWATVLCYASWPVYTRLLGMCRHRRTLAAFTMTVGMVLIFLAPFLIVGATLAANVDELAAASRHWIDKGPPDAPAWLSKVPVVGRRA